MDDVIKANFFEFVKRASVDSETRLRLKSFVIGVGYEKMVPWMTEYCSVHTNPNVPQLVACFYLLILKDLKDIQNGVEKTGKCVVCYTASLQHPYKCRICKSSVLCEECLKILLDSAETDCAICGYQDGLTDTMIPVEEKEQEEENPKTKMNTLVEWHFEVIKLIAEKTTFWNAFQTINIICHAKEYLEKVTNYNRLTSLFDPNHEILPDKISAGPNGRKKISYWLAKYVMEKSGSVEGLLQIYLLRKCNPLTNKFNMSLLDVKRMFNGTGVEHNLVNAIFEKKTSVELLPKRYCRSDPQKFAEDWKVFARLREDMDKGNFKETVELLKDRGVKDTIVWQKLAAAMGSSGYQKSVIETIVGPVMNGI